MLAEAPRLAMGSWSSVFVERWRELDARVRYVLEVVVVAGAYTASGKLGLDLAFATHSVTAIWPPTGIEIGRASCRERV